MSYNSLKIHVTICIYIGAIWGKLRAACGFDKRSISSTRALSADAGPDLQYAENVRAALC